MKIESQDQDRDSKLQDQHFENRSNTLDTKIQAPSTPSLQFPVLMPC